MTTTLNMDLYQKLRDPQDAHPIAHHSHSAAGKLPFRIANMGLGRTQPIQLQQQQQQQSVSSFSNDDAMFSSSHHHQLSQPFPILSNMEASGNENNLARIASSTTQQSFSSRQQSARSINTTSERDSSTWTHTGAALTAAGPGGHLHVPALLQHHAPLPPPPPPPMLHHVSTQQPTQPTQIQSQQASSAGAVGRGSNGINGPADLKLLRIPSSSGLQPSIDDASLVTTSTIKPAVPATGSAASVQPSVPPLQAEPSGDVVIEEKRKRPNGDGYTLHKYIRGRLLGKGGFAKVYLCTALDTNKQYAVKVVPKANLVKSRARQKLQTEIKIHRTLKHPHICEFKHYFEDRENCYILLELCHNQTLNEMIKRRKRLTEPEAAYFLKQLLDAVGSMHNESVIHRDLKLGNLFLDRNLLIKVGDLGLATRVENRDEKRKTICGTPNYIAPEVIQGDKSTRGHSFEVDIWSMGVILYTLLVGKPPYEAKDVKATYQRILANEYSFPRHLNLSDRAKSLVESMLQSDPADRPSLQTIESHAFLTDNIIPLSLPLSVLHVCPDWTVTDSGDLVVSSKPPSRSSQKLGLPRVTSAGRQPFASKNANVTSDSKPNASSFQGRKERSGRDVIDVQKIPKTAHAVAAPSAPADVKKPVGNPCPRFNVYDDVNAEVPTHDKPTPQPPAKATPKPPQPQSRSAVKTEDAIAGKMRSLSINSSTPKSTSSVSSTATGYDNENDLLRKMAEHLEAVLEVTESRKGLYRSLSPRPVSVRGGPVKWVIRYVDYTSKYGLGFLLNDGGSGVYFNDSTKTALDPDGEVFQYIERKKSDDTDTLQKRVECIVETHTVSSYPDHLKKKVTLMTHFRNYLLEQQKISAEDDDIDSHVPSSVDGITALDLCFVKKWVRTKHAILFRLSDQTVQVVFYDQTELLFTPDTCYITYVDKARKRATYNLTDELIGSSSEMEKRLKYTKEIMLQLLSGQRK